jgi:enterochelin esterase-like enzyme
MNQKARQLSCILTGVQKLDAVSKIRFVIYIFSAFLLILLPGLYSQTHSPFIVESVCFANKIWTAPDSSWLRFDTYPVVCDSIVHFIFKGECKHISVAGDFNGWDPSGTSMTRIQGTSFWHVRRVFQKNARIEYKFVVDDSLWMLDPLNPLKAAGGFGDNSELRMPLYEPPPEIECSDSLPHGSVLDTLITSTVLKDSRPVRIYQPPGYPHPGVNYPVILVHDGFEYLSLAHMDCILDRLIRQRKIPPVIAIFIPPIYRTEEYIGNKKQDFSDFIVQELMPWIDASYTTSQDPAFRLVMGSSAGSNIALWLAMNYPRQFGKAALFSAYIEDDILSFFRSHARSNLSVYMNLGTYERLNPVLNSTADFHKILQTNGYEFAYEEYPEGHNYYFWRAHIDDALLFLLRDPYGSTSSE